MRAISHLHTHDLLVGLQQLIADLHRQRKCNIRLFYGDHNVLEITGPFTDKLQEAIHADDMLGKTVEVKGTMYPITGAILVSEMILQQ